ncbi:MAG: hypothetical protein ACK4MF_06965, partial [Hyphomicrobiaceae bacterium]
MHERYPMRRSDCEITDCLRGRFTRRPATRFGSSRRSPRHDSEILAANAAKGRASPGHPFDYPQHQRQAAVRRRDRLGSARCDLLWPHRIRLIDNEEQSRMQASGTEAGRRADTLALIKRYYDAFN